MKKLMKELIKNINNSYTAICMLKKVGNKPKSQL